MDALRSLILLGFTGLSNASIGGFGFFSRSNRFQMAPVRLSFRAGLLFLAPYCGKSLVLLTLDLKLSAGFFLRRIMLGGSRGRYVDGWTEINPWVIDPEDMFADERKQKTDNTQYDGCGNRLPHSNPQQAIIEKRTDCQ